MRERRPSRSDHYWLSPQKLQTLQSVTSRPNTEMAAIVQRGLMLLSTEGLKQATEFLEKNNVPLHVATRVLLRPAERRKPTSIMPKKNG